MQLHKEWPGCCKFGKSLILAWLSLIFVRVIFSIMSTSGKVVDKICQQFLHVFSVNLGVILNIIFLQMSFV